MGATFPAAVFMLALCGSASAQARSELSFSCSIGTAASATATSAPVWGHEFRVTAMFGEGESLALLDPETKAPQRTIYGADVLTGLFTTASESGAIVWTRATSRRAALVGLVVRSDGHVVTIALDRAVASGGERAVRVLDTASGAVWAGICTAQ